jgi:hypothetical protein
MDQKLEQYLEHIRNDYVRWSGLCKDATPSHIKVRDEMIEKFKREVRFEEGSKYIKVIHGSSVHSFICRNDMGKFVRGDILKAASWKAPARNFARGNIYNGDGFQQVRWTGA